jgi:hypothetical protein
MTVAHIKPAEVETFSFDWGWMKWFVSPVTIPGAANSQGEVIINPGRRGAGADHPARLRPPSGRRDRRLGAD